LLTVSVTTDCLDFDPATALLGGGGCLLAAEPPMTPALAFDWLPVIIGRLNLLGG